MSFNFLENISTLNKYENLKQKRKKNYQSSVNMFSVQNDHLTAFESSFPFHIKSNDQHWTEQVTIDKTVSLTAAVSNCWGYLDGSMDKNLLAMQETQVWYSGWKDPLEEYMATHASILA